MNKYEIANFRNNREIDFKNIILNEAHDDKNEKVKNEYLKKLMNQASFKDFKNDDNFTNLIIYLIGKEKKENIDLQLLYNYLIYFDDIIRMLVGNTKDFEKILNSIAKNLSYEKINNNKLVFRQGKLNIILGEIGDKFYLIIQGSVTALLAEEIKYNLTEQEYFMYLIKLKYYEEFEILKKSLNLNHNIYPIKELEFELWLKENNKLRKKDFSKNAPLNLENLNLHAFMKLLLSSSDDFYENLDAESYIENIGITLDNNLKAEKKQVRIFQYKRIVNLSTGQKFGDQALLPNVNNRSATIITTQDCHFGVLTKENFLKSVAQAEEKLKQEAMSFFTNNSLFKGIEKHNFQKNFFNYFVIHRYNRGDLVFNEGDSSEDIYFIKKGEFQVNFLKTIVEINKIIRSFNINIPNNEVEMEKIDENDEFCEFMNKKRLIKISILGKDDVYGMDDVVIDNKLIVTLECKSSYGEIYKIKKQLFEIIYSNSNLTRKNTIKFITYRVDHFTKRLLNIKEQLIRLYFNKQKRVRETNFQFKLKDDRNPENIALNLISKRDIIKNSISIKRNFLKTKKIKEKEFLIKTKELNNDLEKTKFDYTEKINFNLCENENLKNPNLLDSNKNLIFCRYDLNKTQLDKTQLDKTLLNKSKFVINNESKYSVPNPSNTNKDIQKKSNNLSILKNSLINCKSELIFSQFKNNSINPQIASIDEIKSNNLSRVSSMTHFPFLPVRRRYLYESKSMISSNIERENQLDSEKINEIKKGNSIELTNRFRVGNCINFNVYTPLEHDNKSNVLHNYFNQFKEKKIIVNSTFTDTMFNCKYKTLIVKVRVSDNLKKKV